MDLRPKYKTQNYKTHRKQHSNKIKVILDLVVTSDAQYPTVQSVNLWIQGIQKINNFSCFFLFFFM